MATTTSTAAPRTVARPTDGAQVVGTPADKALLIVRIASALVFLYHGSAILFGAFGGPGINGFSAGTHLPAPVAALVGLAQFGGGLALLTGVLARVGAVCIMIVMLGAIFMVHMPHGFDVTKGGFEYAFVQFMIALAIAVDGPGMYSLAFKTPPALQRL